MSIWKQKFCGFAKNTPFSRERDGRAVSKVPCLKKYLENSPKMYYNNVY